MNKSLHLNFICAIIVIEINATQQGDYMKLSERYKIRLEQLENDEKEIYEGEKEVIKEIVKVALEEGK